MGLRSGPPFPIPKAHSLFLIFVLENIFLFYFHLSHSLMAALFLLGVVPTFLIAVYSGPAPDTGVPPWTRESLPAPPPWLWALLALSALGLRLYGLTSIPVWPVTDEGASGFFAAELARHWKGNLYFGVSLLPPGFYWALAVFFKVLPPSLFSLWLFPALISWGTLVLGYAACRQFFSRSISLLWALAFGFSFWPLYIARFNVAPILVLFWEILAFFLLGRCLQDPGRGKILWSCMAVTLAAGFYWSHVHWPPVFLLMVFALGWPWLGQKKRGLHPILFLCPLFLLGPLVLERLELPSESYLSGLWAFGKGFNWPHFGAVALSYPRALLWGTGDDVDYFAYRPFWGGLLNPLLGGVLFTGLAEMVRERSRPWVRWCFGALLVFSLPALLTNNLEMFRWVTLIPLLLFAMALGGQTLLRVLAPVKRPLFLLLFCGLSLGLDLFHLMVVYPSFWRDHPDRWDVYAKQYPCYSAYQILYRLQGRSGPGLVLNQFTLSFEKDPKEASLSIACYPFDAGENPGLGFEKARWAAIFAETPERDALQRSFPDGSWTELGPPLRGGRPDIHYGMWLLDPLPEDRDKLLRFTRANGSIREMMYDSLCPRSRDFRRKIQEGMREHWPLFQGDPFLEHCFGRLLSESFLKDGDRKRAIAALELGHGTGEEFREIGDLCRYHLDFISAQRAYGDAEKAPQPFHLTADQWKGLRWKADRQRSLLRSAP